MSAHFVLALERGATGGVLRQLTGAGVQRVEAIAEPDGRLRIAIHQNRPEFRPVLDDGLHAELAAALGVARDAFDPRCPAQFVCTGHGKLLVGLRSLAQLRALQPDPVRLMALGAKVGSKGFFVFVVDEGAEPGVLTHGRMFAPGVGISEDPVTGNANGPLGAYLVKHGLIGVNDGVARFVGAQRTSTGRGGHVGVEVRVQDGVPVAVRISGDAVVCFRTQLPVPALAAS